MCFILTCGEHGESQRCGYDDARLTMMARVLLPAQGLRECGLPMPQLREALQSPTLFTLHPLMFAGKLLGACDQALAMVHAVLHRKSKHLDIPRIHRQTPH